MDLDLSTILFLPLFVAIWLAMFAGVGILVGFGLWKMCKNAELPHPWICFLYPLYYICKLAERSMDTVKGSHRPLCKWSIWLLWATLAATVMIICCILMVFLDRFEGYMGLLLILFPLCILYIAWAVLDYYALFYLYKDYTPDQEVLLLLLSILLGVAPIIFYVVMNVKPISVAGWVESGQPRYSKYN